MTPDIKQSSRYHPKVVYLRDNVKQAGHYCEINPDTLMHDSDAKHRGIELS